MAPPGPIPNPEVKHWRVDDSRTTGPAKVDRRQDLCSPQGFPLRAAPFPYTLSLFYPLFSPPSQKLNQTCKLTESRFITCLNSFALSCVDDTKKAVLAVRML